MTSHTQSGTRSHPRSGDANRPRIARIESSRPLYKSPIHDRNWYARADVMDGGLAARAGGR